MADARLEIKVGTVSFSGEGAEDWLSQQLDKVLEKLSDLAKVAVPNNDENGGLSSTDPVHKAEIPGKAAGTLAAYLKEKNAKTNQVRKFLATAAWLHDTTKKKRLLTKDITTALNDHNQGNLTNASLGLTRNTEKGSIVKDGKQGFYVVEKGYEELSK